MNWRTLAMTAAVVLLAGAMSFAQGGAAGGKAGGAGGPGDKAGPRAPGGGGGGLEQTLGQLNLTDEQKTKFDQIKADFQKKMAEAREKGGNIRDAYQAYVEEVKGILNEEQLKKFNETLAQRGGAQGARGGMGAITGAMLLGLDPRELQDLKLTADQQEKVRAVAQKFADELKALQEKYQAQIKEVLTDEQKAVLDKAAAAMKDRMRGPGGRAGAGGNQPQPPDGPPPGDGNAPPPPPPGDGAGPKL